MKRAEGRVVYWLDVSWAAKVHLRPAFGQAGEAMKLSQQTADTCVPDGIDPATALSRTTHLGIAAHQDDLEIMAADGILVCYQQPDRWFTGVVVTDGAGSPRSGRYRDFTDLQMRGARRLEQREAARIGEYSAVLQLDHPSVVVRNPADTRPVEDLAEILRATRPAVVYTHNLADKHDTHVAVALRVVAAIRRLPSAERPARLYGCEVWRDLDWVGDDEKVIFDLSAHEDLRVALVRVFDSQIAGGKRYDLATEGRRRANATYAAAHGTDTASACSYALDLTPLVADDSLDPAAFMRGVLDRFRQDVEDRIARYER
jgi:LmbE family N-acetylglucosaminyl deacetylase